MGLTIVSASALLLCALQSASAAPAASSSATPSTTAAPVNVVGNPFTGKQIYANSYYASEIQASAIPSLPASLVPKASEVAKVGTFYWLSVDHHRQRRCNEADKI